ncbi:hypothetical protein RU03_11455 [Pseudomonas simiae]|nr:hypothetical protein RU03_11455 [Pseudomonas simiae]
MSEQAHTPKKMPDLCRPGIFCVLGKIRTDWMASGLPALQSGSQQQGAARTPSWLWKRLAQ